MIILATKQNNNTNRNGRREAFGWTFVGHFTRPLTIFEIPDCAKSLIGVPESVILKMQKKCFFRDSKLLPPSSQRPKHLRVVCRSPAYPQYTITYLLKY